MSRFKKKGSTGTPEMSTASLPDIVFMLLFFFMVSTVMRDSSMKVKNSLPGALQTKKIKHKSRVNYIFVGEPLDKATYGNQPRIQLNDALADISDIQSWVIGFRDAADEKEVKLLIASIKADKNVNMGIITDIKEELREVQQYKINYSANQLNK